MRLFIFAGEMSADHFGASLIRALRAESQGLDFVGVAGPEMRRHGVKCHLKMEDFCVMGFTDVLWSLPRLISNFYYIKKQILAEKPEGVIFIDSPSFSLKMAKALRKAGYQGKIIQYVCPTVWAWGKERIEILDRYFDLLLTIYPFEQNYFKNVSLKTSYVGHPVQETIKGYHHDKTWQKIFGIKNFDHLVALFPGSRPSEIKRNLPKQLEAAKLLKNEYPEAAFAISCAHENNMELVQELIKKHGLQQNKEIFFIPKIYTYELMKNARMAIAKSGTVTLELALHHCPTIVTYELTTLNRLVAKYLLKVNLPYYCIVNILLKKQAFKEFIAKPFTAHDLYLALKSLDQSGTERDQCLADCHQVSELIKSDSPSTHAAREILSLWG